jgi:hypothetical protein
MFCNEFLFYLNSNKKWLMWYKKLECFEVVDFFLEEVKMREEIMVTKQSHKC